MIFHSILFERPEDSIKDEAVEEPAFFVDVNLDQIIDAVTAGKQEYNLKPFFHTSLKTVDAVNYRHEIIADLQNTILFERITLFARQMREMRDHLTQERKLYHKYQKAKWFLDAVELYCDTINSLLHNLSPLAIQSRGFLAFGEYLRLYAGAERFSSLMEETKKLKAELSTVQYCVLIKSYGIKVWKYESESDHSADVEETFAKFKQGAVKDYRVKSSSRPEMNHIEEKVLDFVAKLYPTIFANVDSYCANNRNYLDPTIAVFDREIQFYIVYLEHLEMFKRRGLIFCFPTDIYNISLGAMESERKVWRFLTDYPSGILERSIQVLQMFVTALKKVRNVADEQADKFESEGFTAFFKMIRKELGDDYFASVQNHLRKLKFRGGVLLSAELGKGNKGANCVLGNAAEKQSWMKRVFAERPPVYTFLLHPRDESGARALSELRDTGINLVANALAQSTDHILSFLACCGRNWPFTLVV